MIEGICQKNLRFILGHYVFGQIMTNFILLSLILPLLFFGGGRGSDRKD